VELKGSALVFLALLLSSCAAKEHPAPASFVEMIAAIDQAQPIGLSDFEKLVGHKMQCVDYADAGHKDCHDKNFELAGVVVGAIDFESLYDKKAMNIHFKNMTRICVSLSDLDKILGRGRVTSNCTDGHECLYSNYLRSWGEISVSIRTFPVNCAGDIIMESRPGTGLRD
jgi:hypothetical protein